MFTFKKNIVIINQLSFEKANRLFHLVKINYIFKYF